MIFSWKEFSDTLRDGLQLGIEGKNWTRDFCAHSIAAMPERESDDWSREEVEAIVADYLQMLAMELRGEPFNKAEHNRNLCALLHSRTRGAVEKKHQNISAVMLALGFPYIAGYKPLSRYQRLLYEVVEQRLEAATSLRSTVTKIVEEPANATPNAAAALPKLVARPKVENADDASATRTFKPDGRVVRRNYLEIEARNRSLGRAGEEIILRFEHQRLWLAGKKSLAERIEHVAESRGDGLGYDIASFETNGSERLIEVKTTRFGPMTPFYATRREVGVSVARREVYQLYRVFLFSAEPRLFILAGSMRDTCRLDATQFAAIPA